MNKIELVNELKKISKESICDVLCSLMDDEIIDITDINKSYTRHLQSIIDNKNKIIEEADTCIYNSLFTDSIGEPSTKENIIKKINLLDKLGTHNIEGIMNYLKNIKDENTK